MTYPCAILNQEWFQRNNTTTGCPRKFVPRLPEDHDKAAKGRQHILA